mmetsp:Transcript_3046/g.4357  ORF Transcript_3046/g.4357 Transcript_3046/m.4357 type:complete len:97 (+) Transcript_3046:721-1011(+)
MGCKSGSRGLFSFKTPTGADIVDTAPQYPVTHLYHQGSTITVQSSRPKCLHFKDIISAPIFHVQTREHGLGWGIALRKSSTSIMKRPAVGLVFWGN